MFRRRLSSRSVPTASLASLLSFQGSTAFRTYSSATTLPSLETQQQQQTTSILASFLQEEYHDYFLPTMNTPVNESNEVWCPVEGHGFTELPVSEASFDFLVGSPKSSWKKSIQSAMGDQQHEAFQTTSRDEDTAALYHMAENSLQVSVPLIGNFSFTPAVDRRLNPEAQVAIRVAANFLGCSSHVELFQNLRLKDTRSSLKFQEEHGVARYTQRFALWEYLVRAKAQRSIELPMVLQYICGKDCYRDLCLNPTAPTVLAYKERLADHVAGRGGRRRRTMLSSDSVAFDSASASHSKLLEQLKEAGVTLPGKRQMIACGAPLIPRGYYEHSKLVLLELDCGGIVAPFSSPSDSSPASSINGGRGDFFFDSILTCMTDPKFRRYSIQGGRDGAATKGNSSSGSAASLELKTLTAEAMYRDFLAAPFRSKERCAQSDIMLVPLIRGLERPSALGFLLEDLEGYQNSDREQIFPDVETSTKIVNDHAFRALRNFYMVANTNQFLEEADKQPAFEVNSSENLTEATVVNNNYRKDESSTEEGAKNEMMTVNLDDYLDSNVQSQVTTTTHGAQQHNSNETAPTSAAGVIEGAEDDDEEGEVGSSASEFEFHGDGSISPIEEVISELKQEVPRGSKGGRSGEEQQLKKKTIGFPSFPISSASPQRELNSVASTNGPSLGPLRRSNSSKSSLESATLLQQRLTAVKDEIQKLEMAASAASAVDRSENPEVFML